MASPTTTSNPSPRRAGRWIKRGLIAFLVVANLAVFAVYWRLRSLEGIVDQTVETVPDAIPALTPTLPGSEQPITFLVIGSDSREGLDSLENFGAADGQRADVIIILQVHPDSGEAEMLSLPRDLYVDIPGKGRNKINSAFAFGGAPLMVETVAAVTGVSINHYIEVDFVGFKAIVDELGGVTLDFPYPARDAKSGLGVDAGRQVLDGDAALAYARSRSYQELRDGAWTPVDANDFGRTRRQQQLMFAILSSLARPSSVAEAGSIVEAFASHLTIDQELAKGSLVELAWRMRSVRPEHIEAATLPGDVTAVGEASVVVAREPEAGQMLAAFRAGGPLVAGSADGPLSVRVLNGNGVGGSAGQWTTFLAARGFDMADPGDAQRKDFPETTIIMRPGDLGRGREIIDALGFGTLEAGNVEDGIDAVVIVGLDAASSAQLARS